MKFQQQTNGFTLIELMIVVAIIGILGAIAMPMYANHVTRSKTTEATSQLATMRMAFEQYYLDNRNYGAGGACGPVMPTTPTVKFFAYTCVLTSVDQGYKITATGSAALGTAGYLYTIDQANAKTSNIPGQNGNLCWVVKKGQSC
jgi:type IV pilus assembly protein PilE